MSKFVLICFVTFISITYAKYDFHISIGQGCPIRWRSCFLYCKRKQKGVAGFCATVACVCIPRTNIKWDKFMDEVDEKLTKMRIPNSWN